MSDQLTQALFGGEPAGQPDKQPAAEQTAPTTSEATSDITKPLTLDEVRKVIREEQEADRKQRQSEADRLRNNIQTAMDRALKGLKAAGIQPDQDQINTMRAAIEKEESAAGHSEATSTATPGQAKSIAAPQANAGADWRIQARDELYGEYGIALEKDDPEVTTIDASSPAKLTRTLEKALQAKQARLQGKAAGRLPGVPAGGAGTNPIQGTNDPGQLWTLAQKKIRGGG